MSPIFFCVTPARGMEVSPIVFLQERWCNLVRIDCLQMIKPLVVGFVLSEVDVTLGDGCVI